MFRSLSNVLLLVGRNGFETFKRMPAKVVSGLSIRTRYWNVTQHSKARACCSGLKDQLQSPCLTVAAEVSLRCFELRVCWPRPNGKAKRQKGESQETRRQPDAAVHWLDHWIGSDLWVGFAPSSYSATQELETSHSTR